jgi:hypothetical protein
VPARVAAFTAATGFGAGLALTERNGVIERTKPDHSACSSSLNGRRLIFSVGF